MPAWLRICSPAATVGAAHPARQHRLAGDLGVAARAASAVCVGSVIACGVRIASRPSLFGILGGDLERPGVALGVGVAQDVDRVAVAPVRRAGSALSAAIVAGESAASSPPLPIRASVASTPGPPALVTIVSRGPARPGLLGEHLGHVEDVGDRVDAEHAARGGRRRRAPRRCRSASRCATPRPWPPPRSARP